MEAEVTNSALSEEDQEFFHREGYLLLPGFLDADYKERIKGDVDEMMRHREAKEQRLLVSYQELGEKGMRGLRLA